MPQQTHRRLAFSTLGCPSWPWTRVLDEAVRLGYRGIELRGLEGEMDLTRRPEFSARHVAATVRDVGSRGLAITDLGASSRMHERDPRVREAQMDEARRYIDLAHRLGSPWVRVFPDRWLADEPRERTMARMGDGLATLAAFARGSGVGIAMESHGDVVDGASLAAVMRAAGDIPGVGLVWDAHHTVVAGEAPADTWALIGRWVRHTHLKDSRPEGGARRYVLTGEGDARVAETVAVLLAGGYEGYYSFEWEKRWHPDIAEPEVALPHFAKVVGEMVKGA